MSASMKLLPSKDPFAKQLKLGSDGPIFAGFEHSSAIQVTEIRSRGTSVAVLLGRKNLLGSTWRRGKL
jgi:hypothetical protein